MDDAFYNRVGGARIASRQIDELIGIARGVAADSTLNQLEAEFLRKWLAANVDISDQPLIHTLYQRINVFLSDGFLDQGEATDLLDTLNSFANRDFELGEVLKSTTLPLCDPALALAFNGIRYCFTGTFNYGQRARCEQVVTERGGRCGSLTQGTNVLVVGLYATQSWKHSSFGAKILKASEWRDYGIPIFIVSEEHWVKHL